MIFAFLLLVWRLFKGFLHLIIGAVPKFVLGDFWFFRAFEERVWALWTYVLEAVFLVDEDYFAVGIFGGGEIMVGRNFIDDTFLPYLIE